MSDTESDDNQPDRSYKYWTINEREWSGTFVLVWHSGDILSNKWARFRSLKKKNKQTKQNKIKTYATCMGLRLNSVIDHIILHHSNILLDGNQINFWYRKGYVLLRSFSMRVSASSMKEKYNFESPSTTYYGLLKAASVECKTFLRTATIAGASAASLTLVVQKPLVLPW